MSTKKTAPTKKPAAKRPAPKAAPSPVAHAAKGKPIRVRATRLGYYGEERKRVGDVFDITDPKHFSETWMEPVDGKTPTKTTSSKAALAEQMGDASRAAAKSADNPLGD